MTQYEDLARIKANQAIQRGVEAQQVKRMLAEEEADTKPESPSWIARFIAALRPKREAGRIRQATSEEKASAT